MPDAKRKTVIRERRGRKTGHQREELEERNVPVASMIDVSMEEGRRKMANMSHCRLAKPLP